MTIDKNPAEVAATRESLLGSVAGVPRIEIAGSARIVHARPTRRLLWPTSAR